MELKDTIEMKGTTEIPTGPIKNPKAKDHGYLGGCYVSVDGVATEEEIARMKEHVVEEMINEIRKIAKTREDFFIIKTGERFPGLFDEIVTTVAVKFELPTVKINYD